MEVTSLQAQVLQGNKDVSMFESFLQSGLQHNGRNEGGIRSMFSLISLLFCHIASALCPCLQPQGWGGGETCLKILGPSSLSLEKEIEKNIGLTKESVWVFCYMFQKNLNEIFGQPNTKVI